MRREAVLVGPAVRVHAEMMNGDGRHAHLQHLQMHVAILVGDDPVAVANDLLELQRALRLLDALELRDVRRPRMLEHARMPPDQYSAAVVQLETFAKRARERLPRECLGWKDADD